MKYPLENNYRKIYEIAPIVTAGMGLALTLYLPLEPLSKIMVFCALTLLIVVRGIQALEIYRYHTNLARLPVFEMRSDEIPVSPLAMYLGKGFKWTAVHTQRLYLARKPENHRLSQPSKGYKRAREYEIHHPNSVPARFTRSNSWLNPYKPRPPVGGDTLQHGVEIYEEDIWLNIGERVGHTLVLGTTRVGKTRLLEVLVTQDIHRGDVTIVFDPKGDKDLLIRMKAEADKAGRPFIMFHLGYPTESARYNPIGSYSRITEVATRIANQLPSEGQSGAFQQFVWRYVNVLAKTMEALGIKPTYQEIYKCASNIDGLAVDYMEQWLDKNAPSWRNKFENFEFDDKEAAQAKKQGRDPKAIGLSNFMKQEGYRDQLMDAINTILSNDRSYFEKLVSSLYPLLEKLTTGQVAELISPDGNAKDDRPIFDWMSVIQTNAVVYVGLDSLSDYEVATAVGNAMFSDLTSIAGKIYKHGTGYGESTQSGKRMIAVHADEFNELIGDEFIPLLNKAGGAGFQVTVYTQTWSDVEAKIGSAAKAGQIGGNLNNLIMLRVKNIETAEILTNLIQEADLVTSTQLSGASDVSDPDDEEDFGTQNEDRVAITQVPMISATDIVSLPKGQAFALIDGNQLVKIRMPLPVADDNANIPSSIAKVAEMMAKDRLVDYSAADYNDSLTVEGESYGN